MTGMFLALLLAGLAAGACRASFTPKPPADRAPAATQSPAAPTLDQLKNATVSGIYDRPIALTDGVYEGQPFVPGAASRPHLELLSALVASGDLDGTPGHETAVVLRENSGGSGTFVYVAVFAVRDGRLVNLGTTDVGDRTQIRGLRVADRKVIIDAVEAGPKDGALKMVSSDVTGTLSVATLAGTEWTLVEIDGQPVAEGTQPPTITFEGRRVSGFGGCNRYTGAVKETGPGVLSFGPLAGTKMACPLPGMETENRFFASLAKVSRYAFFASRLLLDGMDGDKATRLVFAAQPAR